MRLSGTAAGVEKYSHLFEPRRIGKLTAPNAVKYAACSVSNFNHPDGSISEREFARGHVFRQLVDYYATQLDRHGVEVRLGIEVSWEMVAKVRPDVGIVATGAVTPAATLPGSDRLEEGRVIYAGRFSERQIVRGKRVVAIGGERAGLVVAERLAQEGNEVAIVDQGLRLAALDGAEQERALPFDLLVVSGPRVAANALTRALMFGCDELYTIGDAVAPRNLCHAVHEGYKVGVRV